jgi:hypothetical protein
VCGSFTYVALLSSGFSLPSIISFNSATLLFTVTTTSILVTTSHTVTVTGSLDSPGPSSSITFAIYLTACDTSVITAPTISSHTFTYLDAVKTFSMTTFSESFGVCGSFTYTIT